MALSVIGSGLGRTGTLSLKPALEALGVGRCYHMVEAMAEMDAATLQWSAAAAGRPSWPAIFKGYSACVDWPAVTFYHQLAAFYPEARVVHTERDPEEWFASAEATIFRVIDARPPSPWRDMVREVVLGRFGGRHNDRDHAIARYRAHNEEVRLLIPPERLLVYHVSQGWGPLCAFLDRPEPDGPMPSANSREDFLSRYPSPQGGPGEPTAQG
jgi:hypothetical protein